MDRPTFAGSGYLTAFRRRPRLLICMALGLVVYLVTPHAMPQPTRALIGWNVGCFAYLASVVRMMASAKGGDVRAHAAEEDEKTFALLAVAIAAATFALVAIVFELGPVKDLKGYDKAGHLTLVGLTILSAWAFTHIMFALHYAAEYYGGRDGVGGLVFPQCDTPGWGEFCYQAYVIGCACATADVNVTTSNLRSVCLVQGVVAFAFNTIILALTINIGAGLVGT